MIGTAWHGMAWHGIYIYMDEYLWYTCICICMCACVCMHDILPALLQGPSPDPGAQPIRAGTLTEIASWVVVACVLACVGMMCLHMLCRAVGRQVGRQPAHFFRSVHYWERKRRGVGMSK